MLKKILLVLLILIFGIGLAILGTLQLVSGNGESQRKGLENAFSMTLQGTAQIKTLHSFNLMPQFNIELEGLDVSGMPQGGTLTADKLHVAFGLIDLSRGTRKIEVFSVQDMVVGKGVLADAPITVQTANITPVSDPKTGQKSGLFTVKGKIAESQLVAEVSMLAYDTSRPSYSFNEENSFTVTVGGITATGIYAPFKADSKTVGNYRLAAYGSQCSPPQDTWLTNKDFMTHALLPATKIKNKGDWLLYCDKIEEQK